MAEGEGKDDTRSSSQMEKKKRKIETETCQWSQLPDENDLRRGGHARACPEVVLPPEVLAHCLSFVHDARDLLTARCVSRLFLALADHEPLWRRCFAREWTASAAQTRRHLEALVEKEKQDAKEDEEMDVEGVGEDEQEEEDADEEQTTIPFKRKRAPTQATATRPVAATSGVEADKRDLPLVPGLTSWKQFYWLRKQIERTYLSEATQADVDGDQPSAPLWVAEPGERTAETYLHWGALLFSKKPEVEDDPMQWKGDQDKFETRMLYVICYEEFLSVLSFPLNQDRLFETYTCLGSIALEYSVYQKQFPHTKQELKTWYALTTEAFKQADKAAPDDFLRANARSNLADIHTNEEAIAELTRALDLFPDDRTEEENEDRAYILHEIATRRFEEGNCEEALEWYNKAIEDYEAARDMDDPLLLANLADALKEKAELMPDMQSKMQLLDEAAAIYNEAFGMYMDSPDTQVQLAQGLAVTYIVKARFLVETSDELEKEYAREPTPALLDRIAETKTAVMAAVSQAEAELNSSEESLADPYTPFLTRNFDACRQYLEECRDKNYLGKMRKIHRLSFANVEDQEWFQRMVAQQAAAIANPQPHANVA